MQTNLFCSAGFLCLMLAFIPLQAQQEKVKTWTIDISTPGKEVKTGHLDLGGSNSKGESLTVNSFYFERNGKPFIPVTGEFHFSRYPAKYWDEEIRKMKAGGINLVATYVFWIIHEEEEGKFDWTGDKDLRKFVETCQKHNLSVIVRIGPFCHGEIRNGGLPDWLFARTFEVRSNDPEYLAYVEKLYNEIGKQLDGLYFSNNGPVIGIQLENEYQHSASPWALTYPGQPADFTIPPHDKDVVKEGVTVSLEQNLNKDIGIDHMQNLKFLAQKAGMIVPLYTATGWGNAAVIERGSIPVTSCYPYPTWIPVSTLSPFYLYTDLQNSPDYSPVSYYSPDYPYFPAEIGGGMCINYTRRPTIPAESLDALINRFLGSGSNGVGYYMYHGGATPEGKRFYFSDEAYAYPKINYDYQAPVGQYGQISPSFHRLRLIHYYLNDFGHLLAPMSLYLPESGKSIVPSDLNTLRYSVRASGGKGFIFINNYQDHTDTPAKQGFRFEIQTGSEILNIPASGSMMIPENENLILPFNFDMGEVILEYATAQLLTRTGDDSHPRYIFFTTDPDGAEFCLKEKNIDNVQGVNCQISLNKGKWSVKGISGSEFTIFREKTDPVTILLISKDKALNAYKVQNGINSYMVFTDGIILDSPGGFELVHTGNEFCEIGIYPPVKELPYTSECTISAIGEKNLPVSYFRAEFPFIPFEIKTERFGKNKLQLTFPPQMPERLKDVFISIDYTGDTGMGFISQKLVDDHFYFGHPWLLGMKKFYDDPGNPVLNFYFRPLSKKAACLVDFSLENLPDFAGQDHILEIRNIEIQKQYSAKISLDKTK